MARFLVGATWEDAPHLSKEKREALWLSIPKYQRASRTKGIPQLGAGKIYPVDEESILVPPFDIPRAWPRGFVLDVGWNRTAGLWKAFDRERGIEYLYHEHYGSQEEPLIHAGAIKDACLARSKRKDIWMPGRIDPASRGRSQIDGRRLLTMYQKLIYDDPQKGAEMLQTANNAVETGIYEVLMALQTGRLKVVSTLVHWLAEFRLYRRNERGRIIKQNDHLMDCTRYHSNCGTEWLVTEPPMPRTPPRDAFAGSSGESGGLSWMNG